MSPLLIRLYRAVQPLLGHPLRMAIHGLRRGLLGDTSALGEATVARSLVQPGWPQWVVEVGANDGRTNSNGYPFLRRGWHGLLVEPNPRMYTKLVANMQRFPRVQCVQAACSEAPGVLDLVVFEGDEAGMLSTLHPGADASRDGTTAIAETHAVQVERLDTLLDRHGVPADFAVLSVDTEGHDLHVLRGLDLTRYRPHIIITETDEATEADKHVLLMAHYYRLAEEVGVNTIWLREA